MQIFHIHVGRQCLLVIVCNLCKFTPVSEKETLFRQLTCNHLRLLFNDNTVHAKFFFLLFRSSEDQSTMQQVYLETVIRLGETYFNKYCSILFLCSCEAFVQVLQLL